MNSVIGVFPTRAEADKAISSLSEVGYSPKEISVVVSEREDRSENDTAEPVATGAVTGAATGGMIGGVAGLLIGLTALSIPGVGALFITGPLASVLGLTGAAATTVSGATTGALAGGFVGALTGLGIPQESVEVYERYVRDGGVIVSVAVQEEDDPEDIKDIFKTYHAEEIRNL